PRHPHLGQAGADRVLPGREGRASRGAALLAIVVGEGRAFMPDAVDVRGPVPHLAPVVVADIPPADIVAPKDEDVRLSPAGHGALPLFDVVGRKTPRRTQPRWLSAVALASN